MNSSGVQRIIPIVLVLIVIAIAVAALFSLGRSIFGGNSEPELVVNSGQESLVNTSIDRSVRLTVRGPIVADENFHSYRISASSTQRTITTYNGYLENQVDTMSFANNMQAYEEFVYALDRMELMKGSPLDGDADDTRGICPTGRVFEYEVMQASNVVKKLWTTTCRGVEGSLDANNQRILRLFQLQIPDYTDYTRKINL